MPNVEDGAAYDRAFDAVIGSQWNSIPDEQRAAAASSSRRGRLGSDAPDAYAVYDTLRYQRGHADVFREVYSGAYRESGHAPPVKGERLLVVDIGAGAATVAVALQEALGNARQRRTEYVAFDPNPMIRQLLGPSQAFEQAIINEYLPGQGIAPHVDRDCFGSVIATVSLGSAVNMDFCRDETGETHVQRLEPRSLVLLHGDARSTWRHGIAKRRTDIWGGQKLPRQRRVSITLRTLADQ